MLYLFHKFINKSTIYTYSHLVCYFCKIQIIIKSLCDAFLA